MTNDKRDEPMYIHTTYFNNYGITKSLLNQRKKAAGKRQYMSYLPRCLTGNNYLSYSNSSVNVVI